MKRHGFAGGRATHGVSKAHRTPGSTGQCQDPGKVFKGKKMAGRMGGNRVTVENLRVYQIDAANNLLMVEGHVPGPRNGVVYVRDAIKKLSTDGRIGPIPTFMEDDDSEQLDVLTWDLDGRNPWHQQDDTHIVKF